MQLHVLSPVPLISSFFTPVLSPSCPTIVVRKNIYWDSRCRCVLSPRAQTMEQFHCLGPLVIIVVVVLVAGIGIICR